MKNPSPQTSSTVFEEIAPGYNRRRRHVRYQIDTAVLFIAPTKKKYEEIPSGKSFFPVRCKDVSRSGFAFFMHEPPDFATLVVQIDDTSFMEAKVVHFGQTEQVADKRAWDNSGQEYESHFHGHAFQVGCQFFKRHSQAEY